MKKSLLAFTSKGSQYEADINAQVNHLCHDLDISDKHIISASLQQMAQHLAVNESPNVLIVDFSQASLTAEFKLELALNQLAEVCEPGTKVIVIGDEIPLFQYRQLLDLGIEEYLTLPVNYDALLHSVKQSLGLASNLRQQHSKNIVITGLQGGVGSTTITAAIAQKLALLGSHSLIADIDTELGDLSLFWPSLEQSHHPITLQQLQEMSSIERITQTLMPRLNYLAIDATAPNTANELADLQNKLATQAAAILWDVPRHHALANTLWLQAEVCIWVLESSVSVLRHWNTIKQYLEKNRHADNNTRHIFVLNQTRKERSEQIPIEKLQQALQQSLIVLPYAGQQALNAANLGQVEPLLKGKFGQGIDDICSSILTRSKNTPKARSPLHNILRPLRKLKSKKVTV
ncbi:MAG: hypothetical protein V7765_04205 [Oleispira sp.]